MSLRTALKESAEAAGVKPVAPPPTPPVPTSPVVMFAVGDVISIDEPQATPTRVSSRKRNLSEVLASSDYMDPKNARATSPSKRAPCADPTKYCSFCCLLESAPRLLTCHLCGNSGHKNCLQFDDRLWATCKADKQWACIECKMCAVCNSAVNDDLMLFCDRCDHGLHMYCLPKPIFSLPKGEWLCPKCDTGRMPRKIRTNAEIAQFKAERLRHLRGGRKSKSAAAQEKSRGKPKGTKNKMSHSRLSVVIEGPIKGSKKKAPGKPDKGKKKAEPKDDIGRGGAILSPQRVGMKKTAFKRRKGEPDSDDEELYDEARRMALDAATRSRDEDESDAGPADAAPAKHGKSWVVLGGYEVQAWYSAPYPEEYAVLPKLYLCEFCLKYMKSAEARNRHRRKCELNGQPPGTEIYRSGQIQMWEIDGADSKIYCQNLCLLSKLFLDHKTLYYDVETFLFYVMTKWDVHGSHFVGYFSKEKDSILEYNLSCIMTLPHEQRQGYGQFLIDFSYLLTRREKKLGSPEKPLSSLGKVTYTRYWRGVVLEALKDCGDAVSVDEIAVKTGMQHSDVVSALNELGFLKSLDDGAVILVIDPEVVETHRERTKASQAKRSEDLILDESLLRWTPPTERPMLL